MIKHATSSVFVFREVGNAWQLGLIEHPRLGRRMIVGGHVEADETQAEAALREAREESGLAVRLVDGPAALLPLDYPHDRVAAPWWITEMNVPADNHLSEPHIHVDHQYVAVVDASVAPCPPGHPFGWFGAGDLDHVSMFPDTRMLAGALFPVIASVVRTQSGPRMTEVLAGSALG